MNLTNLSQVAKSNSMYIFILLGSQKLYAAQICHCVIIWVYLLRLWQVC